MKKSLKEKNKEGFANIMTMVAIALILGGIVVGFFNFPENVKNAFFLCLSGTIINFVGIYMRHGYMKFFN